MNPRFEARAAVSAQSDTAAPEHDGLPSARAFLRTRLGREIAAVLVVKFIVLYALWAVFFSHPRQPDAAAVAQAIAAAPAGPDLARNSK